MFATMCILDSSGEDIMVLTLAIPNTMLDRDRV
jgi:hypothetical protein